MEGQPVSISESLWLGDRLFCLEVIRKEGSATRDLTSFSFVSTAESTTFLSRSSKAPRRSINDMNGRLSRVHHVLWWPGPPKARSNISWASEAFMQRNKLWSHCPIWTVWGWKERSVILELPHAINCMLGLWAMTLVSTIRNLHQISPHLELLGFHNVHGQRVWWA